MFSLGYFIASVPYRVLAPTVQTVYELRSTLPCGGPTMGPTLH